MSNIIVLIITIMSALALGILMMELIGWSVHISMTRNNSEKHSWGNFDDFLKMVKKGKWEEREETIHYDSLFAKDMEDYNNWKLHADIIIFNGRGMILRFIPYIRYTIWKYNLAKKRRSFQKINW